MAISYKNLGGATKGLFKDNCQWKIEHYKHWSNVPQQIINLYLISQVLYVRSVILGWQPWADHKLQLQAQ